MVYNILDYGAAADGSSLCTAAIQNAIDACHAAGGGRVLIPAGTFVSGTVWMRDNVELHLEMGAVLKASENLDDYNPDDAYEQNFGSDNEKWRGKHLIIAHECWNVAVTGLGVIDGSGNAFFGNKRIHPNGFEWRQGIAEAKDIVNLRPGQLICFIESVHVTVQDITMQNYPCWGLFFHGCEFVRVRGIKVLNAPHFGNTDGIDIDCSRFVTVSDCMIDTGDDGITFRCATGRLKNKERICEYVTVTNCVIACSSSAFRIGVGTGRIRHIRVSGITIARAGRAINFMTSYNHRGEAHIEDVNFSDISAVNTGYPISMDGDVGSVRHVTLDNIRMEAMTHVSFAATDACVIEDITLSNASFHFVEGESSVGEKKRSLRGTHYLRVKNLRGVRLENVRITADPAYAEDWDGVYLCRGCEDTVVRQCNFE